MARWFSLCTIAALVLLLCTVCPVSCVSVGGQYGDKTLMFDKLEEFQQYTTSLTVPFVLVMLDDKKQDDVRNVWEPLTQKLSDFISSLGMKMTVVTSTSKVAQEMAVGGRELYYPALVFFDGVPQTIPDTENIAKLPQPYQGPVEETALMHWIVKTISTHHLARIESDVDLYDYLNRFPGFPQIPRVLYFTSQAFVSPLIRVLSQQFQSDAVFGAVVDTFKYPKSAEIARRYNISEQDLPAMVVLYKEEDTFPEEDRVHHLKSVTRDSSVEDISRALYEALPDATVNVLRKAQETNDQSLYTGLQKRKTYIVQETERLRQEAWAFAEDAAPKKVPPPVVAQTTEELRKACVLLDKGFNCLLVFAPQASLQQEADVLHAAATKISRSLPVGGSKFVRFVVAPAEMAQNTMGYFGLDVKAEEADALPATVLLTTMPQRHFFVMLASFKEDNLVTFFLTKTQSEKPIGGKRYIPRIVPGLDDGLDNDEDGGVDL